MRITFVIPESYGLSGGIRVVAIYAEKLQKRGHEVLIVSTPTRLPSFRERLQGLLHREKSVQAGFFYFNTNKVPIIRLGAGRVLDDKDVPDGDVVIATLWRTAKIVMGLSPLKGAKAYFIQGYETFNTRTKKDQVRATWTLPMHKITVSKWLSDLAKERYEDPNVSTVPNAVDSKYFTAPLREKQKLPTFGVMYSAAHIKGCDISLSAFNSALKVYPTIQLRAFGARPEDESLPLPAGTIFELRPSQYRLAKIYASCDGWLFGSRTEGFGLPILEAMACRTPVIGTPAGAAPELIGKGGGILVKPEDPEDMARAIMRLVDMSGKQWKKMSDSAYQTATRYTWEDATDLFETALEIAIARAQKGEIVGGR